jgi:hypothetical protein
MPYFSSRVLAVSWLVTPSSKVNVTVSGRRIDASARLGWNAT